MLKKQNKFTDSFINIFRIITIIGNMVALVFSIILIGWSKTMGGLIFSFSILLFILVNIYFIINHKKISKIKIKKGWIRLILDRKTLEEERKIADIESQLK